MLCARLVLLAVTSTALGSGPVRAATIDLTTLDATAVSGGVIFTQGASAPYGGSMLQVYPALLDLDPEWCRSSRA
jgi:hypothetical protein